MGEFICKKFINDSESCVAKPEKTSVFLVTVHDPICTESGNIEAALYGSFLPIPPMSHFPLIDVSEYAAEKMPGAVIVKKDSPIIINKGRERTRLRVTNNGCRPVQVSSVPNHKIGSAPSLF